MIGRSGERWSRISVLAARHDDDDDMICKHVLLITSLNKRNLNPLHKVKWFKELLCITNN